jgi:hypothetical protein
MWVVSWIWIRWGYDENTKLSNDDSKLVCNCSRSCRWAPEGITVAWWLSQPHADHLWSASRRLSGRCPSNTRSRHSKHLSASGNFLCNFNGTRWTLEPISNVYQSVFSYQVCVCAHWPHSWQVCQFIKQDVCTAEVLLSSSATFYLIQSDTRVSR